MIQARFTVTINGDEAEVSRVVSAIAGVLGDRADSSTTTPTGASMVVSYDHLDLPAVPTSSSDDLATVRPRGKAATLPTMFRTIGEAPEHEPEVKPESEKGRWATVGLVLASASMGLINHFFDLYPPLRLGRYVTDWIVVPALGLVVLFGEPHGRKFLKHVFEWQRPTFRVSSSGFAATLVFLYFLVLVASIPAPKPRPRFARAEVPGITPPPMTVADPALRVIEEPVVAMHASRPDAVQPPPMVEIAESLETVPLDARKEAEPDAKPRLPMPVIAEVPLDEKAFETEPPSPPPLPTSLPGTPTNLRIVP